MWISRISSSVLNNLFERITLYTGNLCHKYIPAEAVSFLLFSVTFSDFFDFLMLVIGYGSLLPPSLYRLHK